MRWLAIGLNRSEVFRVLPLILFLRAGEGAIAGAAAVTRCNRYETDQAYFAAGDTSVGSTQKPLMTRSEVGVEM
jgi:hypothetical protein